MSCSRASNAKLALNMTPQCCTEIQNEMKTIREFNIERLVMLTFASVTSLIVICHIARHWANWSNPTLQSKMVWILSVPVWLSLMQLACEWLYKGEYANLVRIFSLALDLFLAALVCIFYSMLKSALEYDADKYAIMTYLQTLSSPPSCPLPCNLVSFFGCLPANPRQFVLFVEIGIGQNVGVRVLVAIASFVLEYLKNGGKVIADDLLHAVLFLLSSLSTIWMVMSLLTYIKTLKMRFPKEIEPIGKFLSFLFFELVVYWEGWIVLFFLKANLLPANMVNTISAEEQAKHIQGIIVCVEMTFLAIAHLFVYPHDLCADSNENAIETVFSPSYRQPTSRTRVQFTRNSVFHDSRSKSSQSGRGKGSRRALFDWKFGVKSPTDRLLEKGDKELMLPMLSPDDDEGTVESRIMPDIPNRIKSGRRNNNHSDLTQELEINRKRQESTDFSLNSEPVSSTPVSWRPVNGVRVLPPGAVNPRNVLRSAFAEMNDVHQTL